ncbi:MAG: hypothetical protein NT175_09600 [Bacteroidetes bacterium]|nr:hypothetical protein [Bacteroidota bacterium]
MKEQRKLAAIMFTDIVGYSALMSKDELVALQIPAKNREIQQVALRRFNGEFIKEIGSCTFGKMPIRYSLNRPMQKRE